MRTACNTIMDGAHYKLHLNKEGGTNEQETLSEIRLGYPGKQRGLPVLGWMHCLARESDGVGTERTGLALQQLRSPYPIKAGSHGHALPPLQAQGLYYQNHRKRAPGLSERVPSLLAKH